MLYIHTVSEYHLSQQHHYSYIVHCVTYFKQVLWISHGSEEILPEGNLGLPGTVTHRLQELWKLLDEVNDPRKKGI